MRRVAAVMQVFDARIAMCARKGFDAVEIDDIDSFNPPGTTGFQLTRATSRTSSPGSTTASTEAA